MARVWVDADTGEEIIFFWRRGKPYFFLRDIKTKRFIRKLNAIEVRVFLVVSYSKKMARKGNPIYCDLVVKTVIYPRYIEKIDDIERWLEDRGYSIIAEYFNWGVSGLAEISGVEYGSQIYQVDLRENYYPRQYAYTIVWKHKEDEEGKSERGVEKW